MAYFIRDSLYLLIPCHYLALPSFSPLVTTSLLSVSVVCFFFVIFTSLLYFLDSTYKWYHTIFVFLWLTWFISLSIMPLGSTYVAPNGRIFSFLMAELYTHTHTHISRNFFIYSLVDKQAISISWLLGIMLPWTWVCRCLWDTDFNSVKRVLHKWDCWIIMLIQFKIFFEELPYSFP